MVKKIILGGLILTVVLGGALYFVLNESKKIEEQTRAASPRDLSYRQMSVSMNEKEFTAFISDTAELRSRGLSGFSRLRDDEAMIFIFDAEGMWDFWMKDMNFSIDMVWLDTDKSIVGIEKSVSPDTFPKSFSAGVKSMYVLEFNSGTVEKLGIKIGDSIILK